MGTIVKEHPVTVAYAGYYDGNDNLVLVEDLTGVKDRVAKEIHPNGAKAMTACPPGYHLVTISGRQYCVPN